MLPTRIVVPALLLCCCLARPSTAAPILGQIDDFEDGTTMGWLTAALGSPNPAPPTNIGTGGPGGAGDAYLELTALGGNGPGSKLSVLNLAQWAGDYLGAGIGAIAMDVNNMSGTDLSLRLVFETLGAMGPTDVAYSDDPILLAANSGWRHIVFPIAPGDLLAGLGSIPTALAAADVLRLYHSPADNFPNPIFPIDSVVTQLGVDNIQAQASVPEPVSSVLILGGLAALFARRRR